MSRTRLALALLGLAAVAACARSTVNPAPVVGAGQAAVDELLATDRAFSAASARTDLISGLSAMFAADVTMPIPGGQFAEGAVKAADALREANPDNAQSRVTWTPVRGGVSADGLHGFTFGYSKLSAPDGTSTPGKYLAYWVKQPAGWRVTAYRRTRRPTGDVSLALMPAAVPAQIVPAFMDSAAIARFRESLDSAERTFSHDAQTIGLGPAFVRYGRADAINLGGTNDTSIVVGAAAIGRLVSEGEPATGSSVAWSPDRVIVASSGDLGVTIGFIRPNAPPAAGTPATRFAFFTIWDRASASDPWRYIAE
ncbi:MAG: hypothetical protein H0T48_13040 [Gemmatimonadaceae bacterium]|nr:hypothetical protein [Gemmatimonadaceae bacterium]